MEGSDPYVVDGRVGRAVDWKGRCCWKDWKERQLEGLDPYVVDGRIESGHCCWKGWIRHQLEGDWKGLIRALLLEGTMDPDVVAGRDVDRKGMQLLDVDWKVR